MINYLGSFDKFINYLKYHKPSLFPVLHKVDWLYLSSEVKQRYRKGSMKEKRSSKEKLFSRVPNLQAVATVYSKIMMLCNDDVTEKNLSLKELKCFNFLTLAFNLNGRHGPLIELTWEAVDEIKQSGPLDCDNHKTGHFYNIKLKIHVEQFPWLGRLKEEYIEKFGKLGKRVFGTSKDTEEHSMSKIIKEVLPKYFDDDIIQSDFNGNPIRKMWETYVYYNKTDLSADQLSFHKSQSAHGPATAEGHYVNFPKPSEDAVDFYHETLGREVDKMMKKLKTKESQVEFNSPQIGSSKLRSSRSTPKTAASTRASTPGPTTTPSFGVSIIFLWHFSKRPVLMFWNF